MNASSFFEAPSASKASASGVWKTRRAHMLQLRATYHVAGFLAWQRASGASLPAVKPGTLSVAMAKLQGGSASTALALKFF